MKKIIAVFMLLSLALGMVSCGSVNDKEVSVLWSDAEDEYLATIADAIDRAMYIKNVSYTHYDAKGSSAIQLGQVDDAILRGVSALVVNAKDLETAAAVLLKAKAADIPLVFICSNVPAELVESYDKCAAVDVDASSLYETLGEKIGKDLIANYAKYDRNGDGKISCVSFGASASAVETVNAALAEAGKAELDVKASLPAKEITAALNTLFDGYDGSGNEVNETPVELILTDDDAYIEELLLALREYKLNHEKLVTHYIPVYTVGIAANASVLEYGPVEGELSEDDKEMRAAYSVMSAVDDGYLSAAALENDDEIAISTATILVNFIKGNDKMSGVAEAYVSDGASVFVPYTIYE